MFPNFDPKWVDNLDYDLILSMVKGINLIKPNIPVFSNKYKFCLHRGPGWPDPEGQGGRSRTTRADMPKKSVSGSLKVSKSLILQ